MMTFKIRICKTCYDNKNWDRFCDDPYCDFYKTDYAPDFMIIEDKLSMNGKILERNDE